MLEMMTRSEQDMRNVKARKSPGNRNAQRRALKLQRPRTKAWKPISKIHQPNQPPKSETQMIEQTSQRSVARQGAL
jgi:hypothetical protein